MDNEDDNDYKVGPGKPPLKTRFKKGESGNPKGRPKKEDRTTYDQRWNRAFQKTVSIKENGVQKEVPYIDAFINSVMAKAIHGDAKCMKIVEHRISERIKFQNHQIIQEFGELLEMSDSELEAVAKQAFDRTEKMLEDQKAEDAKLYAKHFPNSKKTWVQTADGAGYVADDTWVPPIEEKPQELKK